MVMMKQMIVTEVPDQTIACNAVVRLKIEILVKEVTGNQSGVEKRRQLPATGCHSCHRAVDERHGNALVKLHGQPVKRRRIGMMAQMRDVSRQIESVLSRNPMENPSMRGVFVKRPRHHS